MMAFAIEKLGIKTFQVKIGESNVESINLFKKLVCPLLLYLFVHIEGMKCLTTVHSACCETMLCIWWIKLPVLHVVHDQGAHALY
jgi:hypothetical protein